MRIVSQGISALFYGLLSTVALAQPVVTPPPFTAQNPTLGTLPIYNDASANWKNAGMQKLGGIPSRTSMCGTVLTPLGGGVDDTAQIQAAINNCIAGTSSPVGNYVQLGVGRFLIGTAAALSKTLTINGSISLRGCTATPCSNSLVTDNCNASSGTGDNGTVGTGANYTGSPYCLTILDQSLWGAVVDGTNIDANAGCNINGCVPNPIVTIGYGFPDNALGSNLNWTGTTLTADAAQGDRSVTVASTTGFSIGQWVLIDEGNNPSFKADPARSDPAGGATYTPEPVYASQDFLNTSGSLTVNGKPSSTNRLTWMQHNPTLSGDSNGSGDYCDFNEFHCSSTIGGAICAPSDTTCQNNAVDGNVVNELHLITNISGNTITFDDPLTIAYQTSLTARLYRLTQGDGVTNKPFVTMAGVENLTFHGGSSSGAFFKFCAYCWLRGTESDTWYGGAVNATRSARVEINHNFFHHITFSSPNGAEYSIHLATSTEVYVVDNISMHGGKSMVMVAGGAGSVVSYNYLDAIIGYKNTPAFTEMGANGSHLAGSHHMLFEGNWTFNLENDDTHGSVFYQTFFRNLSTGVRSPHFYYLGGTTASGHTMTDANSHTAVAGLCDQNGNNCNPLRAAAAMEYDYWMGFVANVLGTSGVTIAANAWHTNGSYQNFTPGIWMLGWNNNGAFPVDPNVTTFSHIHANYDYLSNSIQYAAGYSHALPNSFYLSGKPAFFAGASCTYPWPWVTPDASPQFNPNSCGGSGNPAKARFAAGTPFVQP